MTDTNAASGPGGPILEVDGLSFAYGEKPILKDLHFSVEQGEFICIVGPSGTGKSTLLQCLSGLRAPTSGSIDFEGKTVEGPPANLAGISPIPAGSGITSGKHRINHGGHRQLNAAIYRTVIVRMRFHQPTIDYVARRTAEGKSKRDIIRCLKRYVIRELYHLVKVNPRTGEIVS